MTEKKRNCGVKWRWMLWTTMILFGRRTDALAVAGICTKEPTTRVDCYPPVDNFPNATEEACLAQGCCWKVLDNGGVPCAFDALDEPKEERCTVVSSVSRIACRNPRFAMPVDDARTCHAMGCCYDDESSECFQPFFEGYELLSLEETSDGWRGSLALRRFARGPFANDVPLLVLHVVRVSPSTVRVRITDSTFPRFEVPDIPVSCVSDDDGDTITAASGSDDEYDVGSSGSDESGSSDETAADYQVHFTERPFGIAVTRRNTGEVLFNSTPSTSSHSTFNGLTFENQFLEISTHLEKHDGVGTPVLYGLGEHYGPVRLRAHRHGDHYPMFAQRVEGLEEHTRRGGDNLGGVHPFYLQVLGSGRAHGVFFLSANAMEAVTQENALTFRSTGGIFDFFVFTGPSMSQVTEQYTHIVGRPAMPPAWALGYHVGKWGHESVADSVELVARMRVAGVPLEAYWHDLDYMYDRQAFTLDEKYFPQEEMKMFVDDLHFHNQYYVALQTPTIPTKPQVQRVSPVETSRHLRHDSNETRSDTYYPFERGLGLDVFVKGIEGERFAEKYVRSQWSAFVDFFHPNATQFWYEMFHEFCKQLVPFDGVWLDANEPSSKCDEVLAGPNHSCAFDTRIKTRRRPSHHNRDEEITFGSLSSEERGDVGLGSGGFIRSLDVGFPFDPYRQPFAPGQAIGSRGTHGNLNAGTLPMAALHATSLHYNLHSLYGHAQAKATQKVLDRLLQRRSLLVSQSTYAGDGRFTGHWLGSNEATWEDLRLAISSTLQMNLLGIPLSGANVCGSRGNATKELCIRWHQAASFFPLMRNHAEKQSSPQSPVDFDQETANILRETLLRRYMFLPYMYTQFYHAHTRGEPVVRPLAFEFPKEDRVYDIEAQYMVGRALMVSPVVHEAAIGTSVYFPRGSWYGVETGRAVTVDSDAGSERTAELLTPLNALQLHIRGGHIIPTQKPETTTTMTRRSPYSLLVALDNTGHYPSAYGELFVDDGDSLLSVEEKRFSFLKFSVSLDRDGSLMVQSKREHYGYDGPEMDVDLDAIVIFGLRGPFHANSSIHVHGIDHDHVKADYFAHANTLVLTRLHRSIGEDFDMTVKVRPGHGYEAGGEEGGKKEEEKEGEEKKKQGKEEGDDGEGEEADQGAKGAHGDESGSGAQPPESAEQHAPRKKGITTIGIIGLVVGGIFLAGLFVICVYRRRGGYNPIT
ncbi:hypothetical protein Poli38472_009187 [Pythium oligandrum]|uniref:Maltase n=1 Tax=Pythium oligandrum TaxID=41045 RepID=A0A8K1CKP0_PYTOL|nr:hypothetical protein Poli38472_009187 [Pythium oligandrum]|eukprot:TMW65020.1 hypothetical protein Poli38472_009187 [Pythium oligandrum]